MTEPKTTWKLTKEERGDLYRHQARSVGTKQLLRLLAEGLGDSERDMDAWFLSVVKTHQIPTEYHSRLQANPEKGEIWVKEMEGVRHENTMP